MQVQIEHSIQNSQSFFAIIHNNNNISPLYNKNNSNEKEINGQISLSGCHEDPTYVDSYFQRQSVIEELSNELKGHSDSKVPVTLNYGGKQHLVLFNFKCPSQFVFDADKRPISPRRIQQELKSIIVDNVIVQEIDGYLGEEYILSIMGKTDSISK